MRLLFEEAPAHTTAINSGSSRLSLLWFVDDIDSIYTEFREREIQIVSELQTYPYDLREFAFIDINGYYIRVAEGTQKE